MVRWKAVGVGSWGETKCENEKNFFPGLYFMHVKLHVEESLQ
jgi:hypothetical protein